MQSQLDNNLHHNLFKTTIKWKSKRKSKLVKKINLHQDNLNGHQYHKPRNQLKIISNKYLQNSTSKSLHYHQFKGVPSKDKFIQLSLGKLSVLLKCRKVLLLIWLWQLMQWLKVTLCWQFKILTMEQVHGKEQW